MMLTRMTTAAPRAGGGWSPVDSVEASVIKEKPYAANKRPPTMNGIDQSSMRLRPMRSIMKRAARVKAKLVTATTSEVSVGIGKPSIENIVAEKYMSEFCEAD